MKSTVVLIPALNPNNEFISYAKAVHAEGFELIIIDDGSREDCRIIFDRIERDTGAVIIRHAVNLGKGRALKNGMNAFLNHYKKNPRIKGIITADSDGQHAVEDIIQLNEKFSSDKEGIVLGSRNFDDDIVPWKSELGNKLTRTIMKLLHGIRVKDTQTGLRGISKGLIQELIELDGERFEYETNMLIRAGRLGCKIQEIPIQTIYIDDNSETHFNPFKDSLAIYKLIFSTFLKYIYSSLAACVIDLIIFQILMWLFQFGELGIKTEILSATIGARIFSSFINYSINRGIVFKSSGRGSSTLVKYYILCALQMLCSAAGVMLLSKIMNVQLVIIKCIVDGILFFISFTIQKRYVFGKDLAS